MMSRRFSAYSAVESKAFTLREVFGPTGPIQRRTLRWGDRLGSSHAFVTRGSRTSPTNLRLTDHPSFPPRPPPPSLHPFNGY